MTDFVANVVTRESIQAKAAAKLGLDQPSVLDMVNRSKFATDAEYISACAEMEARVNSPEYQALRRRLSAEYLQRQEAEERAAQEKEYKKIRAGVQLDSVDVQEINAKAVDMARSDLAAGRIFASDLGKAIEKYSLQLSERRKDTRASNQLFNAMLRRR